MTTKTTIMLVLSAGYEQRESVSAHSSSTGRIVAQQCRTAAVDGTCAVDEWSEVALLEWC